MHLSNFSSLLYVSDSPRWHLLFVPPVATVISACEWRAVAVWLRLWTLLQMISLKVSAMTSARARFHNLHTSHQELDFWNCLIFLFPLPRPERATLCSAAAHKNSHAHAHTHTGRVPLPSLSALFITLPPLVKDEEAFCGLEVRSLSQPGWQRKPPGGRRDELELRARWKGCGPTCTARLSGLGSRWRPVGGGRGHQEVRTSPPGEQQSSPRGAGVIR